MALRTPRLLLAAAALILVAGPLAADEYAETLALFKGVGESASFFKKCYGYALFPSIGKGGIGIGGAHGSGKVYRGGAYVGDTKMTQVTVGLQFGGQAYSQIIFFENKKSFDDFTSGNFEFGAQASAVAIKASAGAATTTTGTSASASGNAKEGTTAAASYTNGMMVFTVAKGGLMYEASLGGQKFSYKAAGSKK